MHSFERLSIPLGQVSPKKTVTAALSRRAYARIATVAKPQRNAFGRNHTDGAKRRGLLFLLGDYDLKRWMDFI